MITLSKIRSTVIEAGKRIIKVDQWGPKTVDEVSSFGDDGHPVANMTAIYADTAENGDPVIMGYINENQLAAIGEKRIYSLDSNGDVSFFIWLKNNGTVEIGGTADNMVRYQKLDDSLQAQKSLINAEFIKIQAAIATAGGVYTPAPISINTIAAKINEVKTL